MLQPGARLLIWSLASDHGQEMLKDGNAR